MTAMDKAKVAAAGKKVVNSETVKKKAAVKLTSLPKDHKTVAAGVGHVKNKIALYKDTNGSDAVTNIDKPDTGASAQA